MPEPESQTARLYERLHRAILSLELRPGERLSERGLEAAYDGSRTPVRAALTRLAAEGLVERGTRSWSVTPIDLGEIAELGQYRESVEPAAVRLACVAASASALDALADTLATAAPEDPAGAGLRRGEEFHVGLVALSGNRFYTEAMRDIMTRLARTRWLEVRTESSRRQARSEHGAILAAVRLHDADAAAAAVVTHSRATRERLLDSLRTHRQLHTASGLAITGA